MFSNWRRSELQVSQYYRKTTFHPTVLLYHFVMEIIVLRAGQFINLANGFCKSVFRYAVKNGLSHYRLFRINRCRLLESRCGCLFVHYRQEPSPTITGSFTVNSFFPSRIICIYSGWKTRSVPLTAIVH
jgi:hypothetical protein